MTRYGYILDLPLPVVTVYEGDLDPIDFTLKSNNVAIDLSGKTVALHLMPIRGPQTERVISTADQAPLLLKMQPETSGVVRLTPDAAMFTVDMDQVRAFFMIAGTHRNPQDTDLFIDVEGAF